ncbi:AEC family transporter [Trichocoleus desertorum AS-A10]|uniref:AEC family transporter n=1 Tax=Trichocoleus desertorum TaxID=1481672 RepID=UPI003298113B
MLDTLFRAYTPLLIWPGLGLLLLRFVPERFPQLLGQALYWVGVPLQLLVLGRQTEWSDRVGFIPAVAVGVLLLSLGLSLIFWWTAQRQSSSIEITADSAPSPITSTSSSAAVSPRATLGSFILAAMLGNTGFVGLALAQVLFGIDDLGWAVLFSVTSNVAGNYGIAVFIASYFGHSATKNHWWIQLRDVVTVPSTWAFFLGFSTRSIALPEAIATGLDQAVWVVMASALLLVGLRLGSIKGWHSLQRAILPTLLKVLIVPGLVGLGATCFGVTGVPRLVLVLMSGTPTGLSVLILAEVYNLDRELLTGSIALSFIGLLLVLPLWLTWFS